uniref:SWIM-type domain-containing protein n=1 Tax=Heterorhabditis bacteriophora TaxID=37862 RepID=A0A1I7W9A1_HETBA
MAAEDDWLVQAAEQEAGTGIPHPAHDRDNFSFEDSDRFEGDSECSWVSNESLNQNWRGWANSSGADSNTIQPNISSVYPYHYAHSGRYSSSSTNTVVHNRSSRSEKVCSATSSVLSLAEISARVCAEELSFDLLEYTYQEICRQREKVDDPYGQISHSVSFNFCKLPVTNAHTIFSYIKCRVVSCACSCDTKSAWCQHVVALCLFRLNQPNHVQYRVTIWDSVNELPSAKLKKFAQYLINELPREVCNFPLLLLPIIKYFVLVKVSFSGIIKLVVKATNINL